MQDLNDKLTVLHTADGTAFENFSLAAFSFFKRQFSASASIYIGFRKPVNSLYFGVSTGSPTNSTIGAEYWNGIAWTALPIHDETGALAVSEFIRWVKPIDQAASTVSNSTLYWVRFTLSVSAPVILSGIGPLLCSEDDLRNVDYNLDETSPKILKAMVAARNLITKEMQVSAWDILNLPDISDAATFMSLSNIYFNQSDRDGDHFEALAKAYLARYNDLRPKLGIGVDANNNGQTDAGEKVRNSTVYLER